jgi:uncharacterized protein
MAFTRPRLAAAPIDPVSAGACLVPAHAPGIFERSRSFDFFEVHAEAYMGDGGPPHQLLRRIRADHPIAFYATGLSIGSDQALDREHIARLRRLIDRYRPSLLSVPLGWSTCEGAFLNAALPLPHNSDSLARVCTNIDQAQQALGMQILLENPASYMRFEASTMSETGFLRAAADRGDCGLLLDIGNVTISAINLDGEPMDTIDAFPIEHVQAIRVAGFSEAVDDDGCRFLTDDHAGPVADSVWAIYRRVLGRTGPLPTIVARHDYVTASAALAAETAIARDALRLAAQQRAGRSLAPGCQTGPSP